MVGGRWLNVSYVWYSMCSLAHSLSQGACQVIIEFPALDLLVGVSQFHRASLCGDDIGSDEIFNPTESLQERWDLNYCSLSRPRVKGQKESVRMGRLSRDRNESCVVDRNFTPFHRASVRSSRVASTEAPKACWIISSVGGLFTSPTVIWSCPNASALMHVVNQIVLPENFPSIRVCLNENKRCLPQRSSLMMWWCGSGMT